ncbi:MAG: hypothetical protein EOP84_21865 [Verrucomicrobiaceae bacterium]|nr:MAG: hypothetical protein EOP84_21865 [Verrucomicrobiaceae bacterium]
MNETVIAKEAKERPEKGLRIVVVTPVGEWDTEFDKNDKVSEVIAKTVAHFGLQEGNYEIRHNGTTLEPSRPLVSLHLEDGAELELVPEQKGGA